MSTNTPEAPEPTPAPAPAPVDSGAPRVKWNTSQLKSSYINFANANSTQEEVVLNFGMNSNWDRTAAEVEIELTHRIVMSPFAAKRLAELMNKLVAQYESRYGKMK
jgi:hypothetical protein